MPGEDQALSDNAVSDQPANAQTTASTKSQPNDPDPGGSECDPPPHHDKLVVAVDILRYACVVISALFMVEVRLPVITEGKFNPFFNT